MEKIPCEYIVWNVLPSIRKLFAISLMKNYDLNQTQVAEILDLTPSAVSRYLSNKRGGIDITDDDILREIDKSARIIFENGTAQSASETCRICNLLKSI
jgi:predicted transcriptional regulator